MARIVALLFLAAMIVHVIKPLGLPGLRHRRDFWKIAVIAFIMMGLTAMLSHNY